MKNLKSLNLGKSLNRNEMKAISAGLVDSGAYCTCGAKPARKASCGCSDFCDGGCNDGTSY